MCGAPFTNGSVWFKYTDTSGKGISADMSESDFTGGFLIVRGDPGTDGELVGCGPTLSAAKGEPGAKYYIAFSDSASGSLKATSFAPPAPTMAHGRTPGLPCQGAVVVAVQVRTRHTTMPCWVARQRWKRVKISAIYTGDLRRGQQLEAGIEPAAAAPGKRPPRHRPGLWHARCTDASD